MALHSDFRLKQQSGFRVEDDFFYEMSFLFCFLFLIPLCVSVLGWRHPGLQFPCGHTGSLHSQPGRGQRIQEAWNRYLHPLICICIHVFFLLTSKKWLGVKRSVFIKNLTIQFSFIPWVLILNEMLMNMGGTGGLQSVMPHSGGQYKQSVSLLVSQSGFFGKLTTVGVID